MRSPDVISLAEFADTTAATMATMAVVEISGRISTTFSVNFLKKWLITNPSTIGTITTFNNGKEHADYMSTFTFWPAYK